MGEMLPKSNLLGSTPRKWSFKLAKLDQLWILILEPVEERLVGIWSTKFMEEWTTDPEVSSPVWVCAVTLLHYIGKEKCQHSLRSEDDSAEHVLLDGLARRRLCVWCRPRHEVVGTFKRFQRIGAQPETKAIWIWKDRSTISEHGKLNRRESNEQTKFHSRCKNWRSRVSELLCTGTQHLNWGVPESFTQGWVKTKGWEIEKGWITKEQSWPKMAAIYFVSRFATLKT